MAQGDPHITLTILTTSGRFTADWNRNNRGQKVHDDAIKQLRLLGGQYLLKRARDGVQVDLSEKLGAQGLVDGDELVLQAAQPQDG